MNSVGPVMVSSIVGSAMTLHYTENLQSSGARTRAVHTVVCPANHLAITEVWVMVSRYEWWYHSMRYDRMSDPASYSNKLGHSNKQMVYPQAVYRLLVDMQHLPSLLPVKAR